MLAFLARRVAGRILSAPLRVAVATRQPLSLLSITPLISSPSPLLAFTSGYATAGKKSTTGAAKKTRAAKQTTKNKAAPQKKPNKSRIIKAKEPKRKATIKKKKPVIPRIPLSDQPPKRAPTAYNVFASDFVKQHAVPGESTQSVVSAMGATWGAMTEAQKAPYIQRAEQRKVEQAKVMEEYFKNTDPRVISAFNRQRARARRSPGKPMKAYIPPEFRRPIPVYSRFVAEQQATSLRTTDTAERKAAFLSRAMDNAAKWKAMSDAEKKPYLDAFKRDYVVYKERTARASRTLPT